MKPLATASPDDAPLVLRARNGDQAAFEALYRRHVASVARTLYSLVRNASDVDDILQRSFTSAFLDIGTLREPGGFRVWVTKIAIRDAYDQLRSRRRREWLASMLARVTPTAHAPEDARAIDALFDALRTLPPKLRVPWTLHALEGHTFEEVAALCSMGLNTAKRRVAEAQARMDRRLS